MSARCHGAGKAKEEIVKIDKNKCQGCGTCVAVCPKGFELVEGKSKVKSSEAGCINKAIKACPVQAISK